VVGLLVGNAFEEFGRVGVFLVVGPRGERFACGVLGNSSSPKHRFRIEVAVGFGIEGF